MAGPGSLAACGRGLAVHGGTVGRDRGLEEIPQQADGALAADQQIGLLIGGQHRQCDGNRHLAHEKRSLVALLLRLVHPLPTEKLGQDGLALAQIAAGGGVADGRQDMLDDDVAQDVVAGDAEAVTKLDGRPDAGGGPPITVEVERGHGQVGRAAADVDGGHAQRGPARDVLPNLAHEPEKVVGVAVEFAGQLVVEVDELGAGGLVPVAADLGTLPVVGLGGHPFLTLVDMEILPAEHVPQHAHRPDDPAAVDALLGHGHARGHGENDPPQPPGHVGEVAASPLGRGVDGHQGMGQDLHQHEHHEGAAGEKGFKGRLHVLGAQDGVALEHGVVLAQKRRAFAVDPPGQETGRDHGLGAATGVGAPALLPGPFVPQIPFGARHAGRPLGADGVGGFAAGLGADPHRRRPHKGRHPATRAPGQGTVAEVRLQKLYPGLEGLDIDRAGIADVAQLQQIAVVEVGDALGQRFDQNAAGARIADVQDEIHIHGIVAFGIDDLHGQILHGFADYVEDGQVVG
ncbi:hypothetical protein DSECCO2_565640 [anaerobic digester metagenome]